MPNSHRQARPDKTVASTSYLNLNTFRAIVQFTSPTRRGCDADATVLSDLAGGVNRVLEKAQNWTEGNASYQISQNCSASRNSPVCPCVDSFSPTTTVGYVPFCSLVETPQSVAVF